ncbi:phage major tail protein, TP901-1 family, partial [Enterococcus faecalis]
MEKAIQGKKIKLMFRLTRERATTAAKLLALEISHEYKSETKTDTQSTKDGNVPTSGMPSASIEMEFLRTGTETYNMLKYAYRNGLEIDVWRINFDKKDPKTGKYEAEFGTGLLDSFGDSAESDSNSSIKPTLVLNGDLVEGWATVDAENEELARAFFYDTVAG